MPHSTTGGTPSELMFGRQLRTGMDLLEPDIGRRVRFRQDQQKQGHDTHARPQEFAVGTKVGTMPRTLVEGPLGCLELFKKQGGQFPTLWS